MKRINGKEILSKVINDLSRKISLDVSGLSEGTYLLKIRSDNIAVSEKVMIR